jgi:hypothetical protein
MDLPLTRRQLLNRLAGGFGSVALAGLLSELARADAVGSAQAPHFKARAKRVIFLFMNGGPSQVDTFDPKPELVKWEGKRLPVLPENTNKLLGIPRPLGNAFPTPWKFAKHGRSGIDVSELFPNIGRCVDDLCVLRSVCCDSFFHAQGTMEMMTGSGLFLRPSFGSWLLYGLGTENQNLPGFVVVGDTMGNVDPVKVYGSAFLPASFQSTRLGSLKEPIPNLRPQKSLEEQRAQLDLLQQLNELHRAPRAEESKLDARIQTFELAFRMQTESSEAFDVTKETPQTEKLYGIDDKKTDDYGRKCLLARRLVERGVRCVVVNHRDWDQHGNLFAGHAKNAGEVDKPISGLLTDLKQRGLLGDTLVIWGGEFGRTPNAQGKDGRDHNTAAFSMWLAGGGVKRGHIHGQSDQFGAYVAEGRIHTHDFHATLLHLMGLDHEKLTYRYSGRDYRLTDVEGNVVKEILA